MTKRLLIALASFTLLNTNASPTWAQARICTSSDFQACKSCAQLEAAVDLKQPNAGDYYRGAEWNGLYTAYVLNCPIIAAKLIKAGANPSSGGLFGSMIMTVADKWPHNNKRVNDAWAALLFVSGVGLNTPLNEGEKKSTKEILVEESSYKPAYPDLLNLFQR